LVNISLIFALLHLMKKFFTIPLALLILVSGMHFTIATHYCGGKIAATKVSLSGKEATCGMISGHKSDNSGEQQFSRHCCDDELVVYKIDSDYSPSSSHSKEITQQILHEFFVPEVLAYQSHILSITNCTNFSPPDCYTANAVRMADICVFRI
jgi:hypothetical protein